MYLEINDIKFPVSLLNDLREGRLVLFIGAGVSIPAPSSLPSFEQLVCRIDSNNHETNPTKEAQEEFNKKLGGKPLSLYLEELHEKCGYDVHTITAQILQPQHSKPNDWHKAIMAICPEPKELRIVTTNFDLHLSKISKNKFPEYIAPALPLGDNFHGLVYLHGNVNKPEQMILTERDFSKAYIKYARQAAFIRELFSTYPVLFIGYGYNDPIFNFISKSDSFSQKRYIVTEIKKEQDWEALGVEPIYYNTDNGDHSNCLQALQILGNNIRKKPLDEEKVIEKLVAKNPSKITKEEESYLKYLLLNYVSAKSFTRHAQKFEWLLWAEQHGYLKLIFHSEPYDTNLQSIFANWFASENFIKKNAKKCFEIIKVYENKKLNPYLSQAIARNLSWSNHSIASDDLAIWIHILCASCDDDNLDMFGFILNQSEITQNLNTALFLFEFLTRPRFDVDFFYSEAFQVTSLKYQKSYKDITCYIREFHNKIIKSNLPAFYLAVKEIVLAHLRLIHVAERSIKDFDSLFCLRRAIEDHSQDQHIDITQLLVTIARDVIEYEIKTDPKRGIESCFSLFNSQVKIFQRLALHGLRLSELSPYKKLQFLINKKTFYIVEIFHEMFLMLQSIYPELSENDRKRLIKTINKEKVKNPYSKYNLIYCLTIFDPECDKAKESFSQIQSENPIFKPRSQPGFLHYSTEVRFVGDTPIMEAELIMKNPEDPDFITWLSQYENHNYEDNDQDRHGLLRTVSTTVSSDCAWGLKLAKSLLNKKVFQKDLWEHIFYGWADKRLEINEATEIFTFLLQNSEVIKISDHAVARILENAFCTENYKITDDLPDHLIDIVVKLAKETLKIGIQENSRKPIGELDWFDRSWNATGGMVCLTLIDIAFRKCENNKISSQILDDYFSVFINQRNDQSDIGCVMLGRHLYRLFRLNPEWTQENIIPLFKYTIDQKLAEKTWGGYLSNHQFDKELYPVLLEMNKESQSFVNEFGQNYAIYIANLSLFSITRKFTETPKNNLWVDFIRHANEENRIKFHEHIRILLQEYDEIKNNINLLWHNFIKPYWEMRILGKPVPLTGDELRTLIEWSPYLGQHFSEAVKIILTVKPSIFTDEYPRVPIYGMFSNSDVLKNYPEESGRLIYFLIRNRVIAQFDYSLKECVNKIKDTINRPLLEDICNELLSAGYLKARDFL